MVDSDPRFIRVNLRPKTSLPEKRHQAGAFRKPLKYNQHGQHERNQRRYQAKLAEGFYYERLEVNQPDCGEKHNRYN